MLVTLYKINEVHFCLLSRNGFHVKTKNERFTAGLHCGQNLKYENFMSSFGRLQYVKKIASKNVPHVQHDDFSLNQPIKSFICSMVLAVDVIIS